MYKKKMLSTVVVALLAASMLLGIPLVKASPDWIAVSPLSYEGSTIGEEFTVDINVSVTGLAGFEYKFIWNNTLLDVIQITITPPWGGYFIGGNTTTDLGDGRTQHLLGVASLPTTGFTGDATICTYTFKVIYAPYFPEGDGYSLLDLQDTKFSDTSANPITHDTYDGEYTIKAGIPPKPTVYVDPDYYAASAIGEIFTVDVKIRELATAYDLVGWEFWLKYDTTLLDVLDVTIGPFLDGFAGPSGTYGITKYGGDYYPPYSNETFETMGEVSAVEVLLGNHTVPFGNGILATIQFNATYESLTYPPPCCPLELYIVKLADSAPGPIGHFVEDGEYCAPYKPLGRAFDVYTEHERWPDYWTSVIGEGPNQQADAYAPQENVTVCANVTYAGDPIQHKLVAFEIHGPVNPINNITFTRTAFTNEYGVACITFRVPWPCEDSETVIFGNWSVYADVSIAEMKVSDTVWFIVDWIVKVNTVELVEDDISCVPVTGVKKDDYAYFILNITTIALGYSPDALLTVVIYDDLGVPIGYATYNWNPSNGTAICNFEIYIPKWAYVGIGTAYANIYTGMPSECGVPYCPEASTTFSIESAL